MPKTPGIDLKDEVSMDLFNSNVPLASCKPTGLFKLSKLSASGNTFQWAVVCKAQSLLTNVLDASGGLIPLQKSWHRQFIAFLESHNMNWSLSDSERVIYHLRSMLRSLLPFKRDEQKLLPRSARMLQILVDKLTVHGDDKAGDDHDDDLDDDDLDDDDLDDQEEASLEVVPVKKDAGILSLVVCLSPCLCLCVSLF